MLFSNQTLPEEVLEASLNVPDCVFVAPWRSLYFSGALDRVKIPPHCTHTILKWEWEIPEISEKILQSNIHTVFCTSTGPKCPLRTVAYPDWVKPEIYSKEPKSGIFFMGWENNQLRKHIAKAYSNKEGFSVKLRNSYYNYDSARNKAFEQEYCDALAAAKFSICPRGIGTGTRRFWESLAAGAVPILISDGLTLPDCWDWHDTIIRMRETTAIYTPDSILHYSRTRGVEEKSEKCKKAHEFFTNPENLSRYITKCL